MRALLALALSLRLAASAASDTRAGSPEGVGNPVAEIPLASLSATRERPLFAPSRRPPPPPAPAPAAEPTADAAKAAPASAPEPKLLGTAIGPLARRAVVVEGADPPVSLAEGDNAWGWTLRAVDPRSATLEGFGRTIVLTLPFAVPAPVEVLPRPAPLTSASGESPLASGSP
jgi:general secretion pathway protein N